MRARWTLPLQLQRATKARQSVGVLKSLPEALRGQQSSRSHCMKRERSVFCSGKPQDVAEFRTMTLTREVVYRDLRRPKRKMYLTGSKAGGPEPSKSYETKIPDICYELQGLVSAMRGFGLALMQYFLTLPCCFSPTFGMGLCILCHWILQVCHLLFGIRVVTVNRLP